MSTPPSLTLRDDVKVLRVGTRRGVFATMRCLPGAGVPVRGKVLLVPGFTGSKEDFAALLPLLADAGWHVGTYDQRGQYESAAQPDDDFSLQGLAADALAVAESVLGTGPWHVVGHSFGGLVSSTAVIEFADQWRSLTLMCSGLKGFGDQRPDLKLFAESAVKLGLEAIYAANSDYNRSLGVESEPPDVEEFLKRRFLANSPQSLQAMAHHLLTTPDFTSALVESGVRVHVMRGADDDAWPHSYQDGVAAAVGTEVIVIPDAAHSPAVEQPEATATVLDSFWSSSA